MSLRTFRLACCALLVAAAAGLSLPAGAQQDARSVEVVSIEGVIDGPTSRAIGATIALAERTGAQAVVLQIDSPGTVGSTRAAEVAERIQASRVPVIAWVGPPGARAEHGAAVVAFAAHIVTTSPGSFIGPVQTLDLTSRDDDPAETMSSLRRFASADIPDLLSGRALGADEAEDRELAAAVAVQVPELLRHLNTNTVEAGGTQHILDTDPDGLSVRFHKLDLLGRAQHAVAQASIVYLLLLLGLIGIVFEIFHPSTGPAGAAGLVSLALAAYGMVVLDGSWLAAGLIMLAVAAMAVDLRMQALGVFTVGGIVALAVGSFLLFTAPRMQVSPWVLGIGIAGMIAYMLGAMTKVMRDLRAVASGEREIIDLEDLIHERAAGPDEDPQ